AHRGEPLRVRLSLVVRRVRMTRARGAGVGRGQVGYPLKVGRAVLEPRLLIVNGDEAPSLGEPVVHRRHVGLRLLVLPALAAESHEVVGLERSLRAPEWARAGCAGAVASRPIASAEQVGTRPGAAVHVDPTAATR